jgi:hypothetical protein
MNTPARGPYLIAALLAVIGLPVVAQERPVWSAELWATEGGEENVAALSNAAPAGDELVPTLALMCGFYLRYDPGPIDGSADWTGQTASFEFDFGERSIERVLQYEAMDGMFAAPLEPGDPLVRAIETGTEVTVLMPNGGIEAQSFSLRGSAAAIAEMRRSCR